MWGSAFSDIAKKAQELQEQANQAASQLSTSSPFNLDAMQQQTAAKEAQKGAKPVQPPEQAARPVQPTFSADAFSTPLPRKPLHPPKGKLQIPLSPTLPKKLSVATPLKDKKSPHRKPTLVQSPLPDVQSRPPDETSLAQEKEKETSNVESGEKEQDAVQVPLIEEEATTVVMSEKVAMAQETGSAETTKQVKLLPNSPDEQEHVASESDNAERDESAADPLNEESLPQSETNAQTATQREAPQKSLVLLISTLTQKSINLQGRCFQTLKIFEIPYEIIDAIDPDPMYKELRNDLVSVSKTKEFPQFFLVDLSTGQPTFWGTFETFQRATDDGTLRQKLFAGDCLVEEESDGAEEQVESIRDEIGSEVDRKDTVIDMPATTHGFGAALVDSSEQVTTQPPPPMADRMMEQFSEQMKRVEENHLAEIMEMETQHTMALAQAQAASDHSACEAARLELEQTFQTQIREKDDALHELMRLNEGYRLKMDVLKREVTGTQALLAMKDSDMGSANEASSRVVQSLEEQVKDAEAAAEQARQRSKKLEKGLESTREELSASKSEYAELKTRAKGVAEELKERRVECRDLRSKLEEQIKAQRKLHLDIENLQYQLTDQHKTGSERHGELERLRGSLVDAKAEIEKLRKTMSGKEDMGKKALDDYKKKAQNSLALANSRTAAAVQAKEEAELEARAARSTADTAMDRAVKAETETKLQVKEMESQKSDALKQASKAEKALAILQSEWLKLKSDLEESEASEKRKTADVDHLLAELAIEQAKSLSLEKKIADLNIHMSTLREDTSSIREQLRQTEASLRAVPVVSEEHKTMETNVHLPHTSKMSASLADQETIEMLQGELCDAKRAISDLKEALMSSVEQTESRDGLSTETKQSPDASGSSVPLFYAMEKQAELNTARSEINRLANLLSNAQSEKMEAVELTNGMRKRMEEAEARLQRYEKLRRHNGSNGHVGEPPGHQRDNVTNSGDVNIEYLKNIMLRYLSAKNVSERKALVPVIGAVLCLTEDEQSRAFASLEESSSIGVVGSSIFESISGSLLS